MWRVSSFLLLVLEIIRYLRYLVQPLTNCIWVVSSGVVWAVAPVAVLDVVQAVALVVVRVALDVVQVVVPGVALRSLDVVPGVVQVAVLDVDLQTSPSKSLECTIQPISTTP